MMRHAGAFILLTAACAGCVSVTGRDPSLRTPGELVNDIKIERQAIREIRATDERLATSHIDVESYEGIVLITGEVEADELRSRAAQAVAGLPNVRKVHNELRLSGPSNLVSRANDSWLTTKVVSRFAASKEVDATRIKVVAEDGVVYLLGVVSRAHGDAAAEEARKVFGVNKVVKVFDYL